MSGAPAQSEARLALQRLRQARLHWVILDEATGRRVQFMRPLNDEAWQLQEGDSYAKQAAKHVVAWEGFTEATFLGDAIGSSDALEFDPELWAEYIRDRLPEALKVYQAIVAAVVAHNQAREAAAKN